MVCPPFCSLFSLAVRADPIEDRIGCIQRELLALRQVLCKQGGVAVGHVKGFATLHTAHVQRALAALGVKILIKRFMRPAFGAAAHLFFRLQLRKVSIHGAEADLKKAEETYRDTVNAVNLDVRSNYLGLREAEKRISTTKLAVEQADEDYRIAQLRYMSGVGTNTDVLDAQVALTQAKTNYTKALYDYNTSKTALETSIGVPMSNPATAVKVQAAKTAKAVKAAEEKTEEAAK